MKNSEKNDINNFSQRDRKKVPKEFTWNDKDVYLNIDEWEKDLNLVRFNFKKISTQKKTWTNSADKMFATFALISNLRKKINKLYTYVHLFHDTDMSDNKYIKMEGRISSLSVEFQSQISFVESDIVKMNKKTIERYYKDKPELGDYKRKIDLVLKLKNHILEEGKESLISMTGLFSDSMEKASSILNNVEIPSPEIKLADGKEVKLDFSSYERIRASKNRMDRRKVMEVYWKNKEKFKNTLATLLDGEIKKHVFYSKVYNFDNSLNAALTPKGINREVYLNLIKGVKENLSPLHRYLNLKKKLLGLKKIEYSDIYVSSVSVVNRVYTIDEAKEKVVNSLEVMGNDYIENLKKGFNDKWMDVYPNKNKRSGAYSNGAVYDAHPFVLMNYNESYAQVSTLAHEFGHAMHSFYSNKFQPYSTSNYPIFLAEIASTFNETLLADYFLEKEEDDMVKLYIIDKQLETLRTTVYRQTLFAEFELMMHEYVESGNSLTADWLNENYLKLTRDYYGHDKGVVIVDDYFKSEWSGVPHFYYNFYVYQYATGIIAAMNLVDLIKRKGESARNKYLNLLKSGDSVPPLKALKLAGVDLTKKELIKNALLKFNVLVDEMEKIVKKVKK